MRIVSDFKDYYDGGMGFYSPEPLYIRKAQMLKLVNFPSFILPSTGYGWRRPEYPLYTGAVSLAGRYYPFLNVHGKYYYKESNELTEEENKFFKPCERRIFVARHKYKTEPVEFTSSKIHEQYKCPIIAFSSHPDFRGYITTVNGKNTSKQKWKGLELNPCLNKYQFYKVKDPFTTFQEIEMWLSNQATPEKPIPSISNNDMIEAKGFDLKSSFRNSK